MGTHKKLLITGKTLKRDNAAPDLKGIAPSLLDKAKAKISRKGSRNSLKLKLIDIYLETKKYLEEFSILEPFSYFE